MIRRALYRTHHRRKRMTQQHRSPRAEQVEVPILIRVVEIRSLRPHHHRRIPTDRTKRAHRRVHSAWQKPVCSLVECSRSNLGQRHAVPVYGLQTKSYSLLTSGFESERQPPYRIPCPATGTGVRYSRNPSARINARKYTIVPVCGFSGSSFVKQRHSIPSPTNRNTHCVCTPVPPVFMSLFTVSAKNRKHVSAINPRCMRPSAYVACAPSSPSTGTRLNRLIHAPTFASTRNNSCVRPCVPHAIARHASAAASPNSGPASAIEASWSMVTPWLYQRT